MHWRTNSWSIRGETRLSLSQPACLQLHPAAVQRLREHISQYTCSGQRDRGRVNLMKQMQRWLNNARVLECVRASFVSDCCLSFFLPSCHLHTHTITQSHKHDCINIPQIFSPDPRGLPRFSFVTSTTELSFRVLLNSLPGPEARRCAGWHFGYVQFVLRCTDMLQDRLYYRPLLQCFITTAKGNALGIAECRCLI